jgi:hypothetical protein
MRLLYAMSSNGNPDKTTVEGLTHGLYDKKRYTDNDILAMVRGKVKEYGLKASYSVKRRPKNDKECQEFWPYRVKADGRIRRLRLISHMRS